MLEKIFVSHKEEPLKWLCNEAYHKVRGFFPYPASEKKIAFFLGTGSGYLVAEIGASVVYPYLIEPVVGDKVSLDQIASYSLTATVAAPPISYLIAPKKFKEWLKENPVYSRGVAGVMFGASLRALQELFII